jgi:hypothetical protein
MTDEECCVAGGENIHWCPGNLSGGLCMNSTDQICCEDGHVCFEEDCCDIVVLYLISEGRIWLIGLGLNACNALGNFFERAIYSRT